MTARLLIVGPQGSGKGTQGVRIAEAFGVPAVSTGDVFRANISEGTALGQQVQAIIAAGNLVPDELTSAVVRDRLGIELQRGREAPPICSPGSSIPCVPRCGRATSSRTACWRPVR